MTPIGMIVQNTHVEPSIVEATSNASLFSTIMGHVTWWQNKVISLFSGESKENEALTTAKEVAQVFHDKGNIRGHILDFLTVEPSEAAVRQLCEFPVKAEGFVKNTPMKVFDDYMRVEKESSTYKVSQCAETYFRF